MQNHHTGASTGASTSPVSGCWSTGGDPNRPKAVLLRSAMGMEHAWQGAQNRRDKPPPVVDHL